MFSTFEEKGKIFTNVIVKNPVEVLIQTTHQRIQGKFHIRPEDRLKDGMNLAEDFVAITDASVYDDNGQVIYQSSFLTVQRQQIVWLIPVSELQILP